MIVCAGAKLITSFLVETVGVLISSKLSFLSHG